MMLATLHGKRNLGCSNCSGKCSDCKSLSVLSGFCGDTAVSGLGRSWYESAFHVVANAGRDVGDIAGDVGSSALDLGKAGVKVVKSAGSVVGDVITLDRSALVRDFGRTFDGVGDFIGEGSDWYGNYNKSGTPNSSGTTAPATASSFSFLGIAASALYLLLG